GVLPFFLLLYLTLFTIGRTEVIESFRIWLDKSRLRVFVFPLSMLLFYVTYMLCYKQDLLSGHPWLLIYVLFVPSLVYFLVRKEKPIGWIDFTLFLILLLPSLFFSVDQNSEIPVQGNGFDHISHVLIMLSGVYGFAIVRGIADVGFELKWNVKSLLYALMSWALFYGFVFVFGYSVNFIAITGINESFGTYLHTLLFTFVITFLHTALFEELFFRGILQNMLSKRIARTGSWKTFLLIGFIILFIGALLVGYTLEGKMKWWPAFMTVIMFLAAYFLEKSGKHVTGAYSAIAITGVTFGLVHYHAKSIIYIGLACLAGWAYGYTYHKTKNVFYGALVHVLVNVGVMLFGLKMIR
ncbi:MAG: CPBP family intramembrane metalloprotease, partial [Marinilabiliales bacterium]|nr:CPBP family intramembrane metalloprotease [Marinilabiliales bacterium]